MDLSRLIAERLVHERMRESRASMIEDLTRSHPANGPRIGSKVRILRGGYRGQIGKVVDIDFDEEEGDQYSVETPDKSIRYLDDTDIELIKEDLTLDER